MIKRLSVLACVIGCLAGPGLLAQTRAGAPSAAPERHEVFFARLQRAVAERDRRAVVAMVQYPINVFVSGRLIPITDAAMMTKVYDAVFTPALEDAIADSSIARAGQQAAKNAVRTTDDGMSIATGLVYAQRSGTTFKILRITVPPPSAAPARPVRRAPTRVVFNSGPLAQFSGLLLKKDEVQTYLVRATKGQTLQVRIDGFRGRDAELRVLESKSGKPVNERFQVGPRGWSGPLPATDEFRIDVVRLAADGQPAQFQYVLAITLR